MTLPPKTYHVRVAGGRLAYHDGGDAERGVLALPPPGWPASRLGAFEAAITARDRRILTLDLRGHGQSSKGFPRYTFSDVVSDAIAVLDHARQEEVDVLACSASAAAAVALAVQHPRRVRTLTLVAPRLRWTIRETTLATMLLVPFAIGARTRLWAEDQNGRLASRPPTGFTDDLEAARRVLEDPERLSAALRLAISGRTWAFESLGRIAAPTLLAFGSQDPLPSNVAVEAETLASAIDAPTEVAVLPAVGHAIEIEAPVDLAGLMVSSFGKATHHAA